MFLDVSNKLCASAAEDGHLPRAACPTPAHGGVCSTRVWQRSKRDEANPHRTLDVEKIDIVAVCVFSVTRFHVSLCAERRCLPPKHDHCTISDGNHRVSVSGPRRRLAPPHAVLSVPIHTDVARPEHCVEGDGGARVRENWGAGNDERSEYTGDDCDAPCPPNAHDRTLGSVEWTTWACVWCALHPE